MSDEAPVDSGSPPTVPRPAIIEAIDVYEGTGEIDWRAVAEANIRGVWAKLSEGVTWTDRLGDAHLRGAADAGLLVGGYHFLTATSSPESQAAQFASRLPQGLSLPPMIDVERGRGGGRPDAGAVLACASALEQHLVERGTRYTRPLIYCSPSYAIVNGFAHEPRLGAYKLWIAEYSGGLAPTVPAPWIDWSVWQNVVGPCSGIRGDVDHDCVRLAALDP